MESISKNRWGINLVAILLCSLLFQPSYAEGEFQLKFGSFIYHFLDLDPEHPTTQYFENYGVGLYVPANIFSADDKFVVSTMKNSFGYRCFSTGLDHPWQEFGNNLTFRGSYLYVGEFFSDAFAKCGTYGAYAAPKDLVGFGFAAYIDHYIEYRVNPWIAFDFGWIFPHILEFNAVLSF